MKHLYNIFISVMIFGFKVGAAFSYKLKRGLAGRRQSCDVVKSAIKKTDKVIWMHAASLGEYEQGLPVLEQLKAQNPEHKVLITFFSPSGYEVVIRKNHIADVVCYLPFDLDKWVSEFTSQFQTDIFFTVKYDFWYNLLRNLKENGAKIYVISALFYEKQIFFQVYGKWFTEQLKQNVDWFFHQTKNSYALAKTIGINNSSIAGDTRFDRVKQLKNRNTHVDFIEDFRKGKTVMVFGSSWEAEEQIAQIVARRSPDLKMIIAPHDLKRVEVLKSIFPSAILYSQLTPDSAARHSLGDVRILIIDSIGLLSRLYSYADLAVVGGGFHSAGLHNILEAATFGIPVFFGNRYKKNPEADELIRVKGGKSFEDEHYASDYLLKLLKDGELLKEMGKNAGDFIAAQPDSTEIIMKKINGVRENPSSAN